MSDILWRLGATIFFVILNGFFVAAEFSLVKVRPGRVASIARGGNRSARVLKIILARLDLYLSACQLGITIASLILGWLAEPALAALLLAGLEVANISVDPDIAHAVALGIALTIVTVLHMTVGEQAPKIWSIRHAEKIAIKIAYPVWLFTLLFRPLILTVNVLSNLLLRLAGLKPDGHHDAPPDATEFRDLLARSASTGVITPRQGEFARNALDVAKLEVRHILVPRADLVGVSVNDSSEESLRRVCETRHTRFPLYDGDLDSIVGIVHVKDILNMLVKKSAVDLKSISRQPVYIPQTQKVSRLIFELQKAASGCAVVVDEYGGTEGIAFLDDALEEIVGPIRDEFDTVVEEYNEVAPGVFELNGTMDLPTVCELLGIEDVGDEDTIAGYVLGCLERLPVHGDKVEIGSYTAEVKDIRDRRIHRLRVEKNSD